MISLLFFEHIEHSATQICSSTPSGCLAPLPHTHVVPSLTLSSLLSNVTLSEKLSLVTLSYPITLHLKLIYVSSEHLLLPVHTMHVCLCNTIICPLEYKLYMWGTSYFSLLHPRMVSDTQIIWNDAIIDYSSQACLYVSDLCCNAPIS